MLPSLRRFAVILGVSLLLSAPLAWSQSSPSPVTYRLKDATTSRTRVRPFSQLAAGVKFSTLGLGVELATPLSGHFNLRVGGNFFQYTGHLTTNGIHYAAALDFSSAQASIDWFPWRRSFHLSPGALVYSGNRIIANGSVPGGTSFTINGNNYVSDPADPVGGSARIDLAHAAPMLTFGWGNLIPRKPGHIIIPFEMGFAYIGDPKVGLNFGGSVCDAQQLGCEPVQSDPTFQSDVAAEKAKIQNNVNYARFYPILSLGFAYRF